MDFPVFVVLEPEEPLVRGVFKETPDQIRDSGQEFSDRRIDPDPISEIADRAAFGLCHSV